MQRALIKYWKGTKRKDEIQRSQWHAQDSYEIVRGPVEAIATAAGATAVFQKKPQGGATLYLAGEDTEAFRNAVNLCREIMHNRFQIKKGKKQGLVRKALQEHEKRAQDKRRDMTRKRRLKSKYRYR